MIAEPRSDHVVWLDGEFVPWHEATIHLSAHHYGVGVFEGVRAYATERGTAVFRLEDHTRRLFRSAHILGLSIPYSREELDRVQREVLSRNDLGDAYVRPFVFFGGTLGLSRNIRGLSVHVSIMVFDWRDDGAYQKAKAAASQGLSLRTSSFVRSHGNSLLSKAKANGNYMNGILALQEAQSAGADEAMLLDASGFVTETSGSNLFAVRDGTLLTPPLESVLEGITRDTVATLARELGWSVVERRMTRDEIYVADEVFLTGTAAEIVPVREVDGRSIGRQAPGPVTQRLQSAYQAVTRGQDARHADWLSTVLSPSATAAPAPAVNGSASPRQGTAP